MALDQTAEKWDHFKADNLSAIKEVNNPVIFSGNPHKTP